MLQTSQVLTVVRRRGVQLGKVDGRLCARRYGRRVRHQRKVDHQTGVKEAQGREQRRWWALLLLAAAHAHQRRGDGRCAGQQASLGAGKEAPRKTAQLLLQRQRRRRGGRAGRPRPLL